MIRRNNKRLLEIAIIVSIVSILITIFINLQIANNYSKASGKNKALFGLIEMLQYSYQYYVAILGILSFIIVVAAAKTNGQKVKKIIALLLSLFAIIIVFVKIWRLFI